MLPVSFAPIQGITDALFRNAHHGLVGGIDEYYTPFIRYEHKEIRNKDRRDVALAANQGLPAVAQVIANGRDEFCLLCDFLQAEGWHRIDINLGCPFPMQTGAGRGAGMLPHPDRVEAVLREAESRKEVQFSVKMRLGLNAPDECLSLLPLLNSAPLCKITLHARTAKQQYKGLPDMESFTQFYELCSKPIFFNGNIETPEDISNLEQQFPKLAGVMIGRGLVKRPSLAAEYAAGEPLDEPGRHQSVLALYQQVFVETLQRCENERQVLNKMQTLWEYQKDGIDKKIYKQLVKSSRLTAYREAVATLRASWR